MSPLSSLSIMNVFSFCFRSLWTQPLNKMVFPILSSVLRSAIRLNNTCIVTEIFYLSLLCHNELVRGSSKYILYLDCFEVLYYFIDILHSQLCAMHRVFIYKEPSFLCTI